MSLPEAPPPRWSLWRVLGPGLVTGAADDDPSGIGTYSQAGAQFGYRLGWTLFLSWPLMCAIQEICGRVGRVTGRGLAGALRQHYPRPLALAVVALLAIANTINLGADVGAMGAALDLLLPGPVIAYIVGFGLLSLGLEIFVRYERYEPILKFLTLSLFAYVASAIAVHAPWREVLEGVAVPHIALTSAYLTVVLGVLGTTISPYLFFWQAEEEAEDLRLKPGAAPLRRDPTGAPDELRRIRFDTWIGMGLSNLVALFIIITTAATLHAHGITDVGTADQAARALTPIAGPLAGLVFTIGIVGTGLLALPVLAGSAAYAVGEVMAWRTGLGQTPRRARRFYGVLALSMLIGIGLNLIGVDPMKALFWSAVFNGVAAAPLMVMIMVMAQNRKVMGGFVLPPFLRTLGWIATGAMAVASLAMFATLKV